MPIYDTTPVEIAITVSVDGHTFRFHDIRTAKGRRYRGELPAHQWQYSDVFEYSARIATTTLLSELTNKAFDLICRLYPVHPAVITHNAKDEPSLPTDNVP